MTRLSLNSLVIYSNILHRVIGYKMDPSFYVITPVFATPDLTNSTQHISNISPVHLTLADLYVANIYTDSQLQDQYPELFI